MSAPVDGTSGAGQTDECVVLTVNTLGWGGVEGNTVDIALGFARRGIRTAVVVDHEPLPRLPALTEAGIPVEVLNADIHCPPARYKEQFEAAVRKLRARIIHAHGWEREEEIFQIANKLGVPVVRTIHETIKASLRHRLGIVNPPIPHWRARRAYNRENPIVLNISDASEAAFHRIYSKVTRSRRVYYGSYLPPQPIDSSAGGAQPRVLWAGTMDHRKRPFLALSIWRDIVAEYPKAHLTMLGGGLLLDEARKRAELLPPGTISLPGPTRDVRSHYQQSQILLHTSSREGIPLVLFEAMNYGIPVVTTNSGATAELIKDGQTGILAAINDEAALTAGLRRLIADPRLRGAMGEAARARGAAMFDIEEYLRQILQAYVELGGIELPFIHSQNGQKPTAARGGGYAGAGASPGVP